MADNLNWNSPIKIGLGFIVACLLCAFWFLYSEQNGQVDRIMIELREFVRNSTIETNKHNLESNEKFYKIQLNIEKNNLHIMAVQQHIRQDGILTKDDVKNVIREGVP